MIRKKDPFKQNSDVTLTPVQLFDLSITLDEYELSEITFTPKVKQ
jgi:hypothetical protein